MGAAAAHAEGKNPDHAIKRSAAVMGTIVHVAVWHDDDAACAAAIRAAFDEIRRIDALMTSWTDDSAVARINAAAGKRAVKIDSETLAVAAKAMEIARLTDGAFDITVGAFHNLWKFGTNRDDAIPSVAAVTDRLTRVGYRGIRINRRRRTIALRRAGMAITLGGIAKGYAVDRAAHILRGAGFVDFLIQAGGDLYISGRKGDRAWQVGIRDPRGDRGTPFAVAPVQDKTFSTSGDYERAFVKNGVRYHHILDPKTGHPATGSRSVTVMAEDAMTADGLSTALFVMGAQRGLPLVEALPAVEAVFVDTNNRVHVSSGLRSKLRILNDPTDGV